MIRARRIRIGITLLYLVGTIWLSVTLWSEVGTEDPAMTVFVNLMLVSFSSYNIYVTWTAYR